MTMRFTLRKLFVLVAAIATVLGLARVYLVYAPVVVIESSCDECDIYLDDIRLGHRRVSITAADAFRLGIHNPEKWERSKWGAYLRDSRRSGGAAALLHLRPRPGSGFEGELLRLNDSSRKDIVVLDKVFIGISGPPRLTTPPPKIKLTAREIHARPIFTFAGREGARMFIDVDLPADFIAARDRDGLDIRVAVNARRFSDGGYVKVLSSWPSIKRDAVTGREFVELDVPRGVSHDQVIFFASILDAEGWSIKGFESLSQSQQVLPKAECEERAADAQRQAP